MVSVDVKQYWTELRSCVKVEIVAVLGSPSLISFMVSMDVKQHWTELRSFVKVDGGGRPGLPVPNTVTVLVVSVDVTFKEEAEIHSNQQRYEVQGVDHFTFPLN